MARVALGGGDLVVAVDAGAGSGTAHGLILEPYADSFRNGFRVRQDELGVPRITTTDADCLENQFANDVVCNGTRARFSVTTRGGADRVTLRGDQPGAGVCQAGGGTAPVITGTVSLGAQDDFFTADGGLNCPPGSASPGQVTWRVTVDGEAGLDVLRGGAAGDTLIGGPDANVLDGRGGDDLLRGGDQRDEMAGEAGDDTLRGGGGLDAFSGGDGDDLFHGALDGAGPDVFVGGPGVDTVTYALPGAIANLRQLPVSVTIFDPANVNVDTPDGTAGENDTVQGDVENVIGGTAGDSLRGNNLANRIDGGPSGDTIIGAAGADTLLGGPGDDSIGARDTERDPLIDCGPGTDSATVDLVDRTRPAVSPINCEVVIAFASDDGPPARLSGQVLRTDAGGVALARLTCPRDARVTCRGTLTLRRDRRGAPVLRRVRYAVARGESREIAVRIPASLRGRRAVVETVEKGVSVKGPRGVVTTMRVV